MWESAKQPGGIAGERAGAAERAGFARDDWTHARALLVDVEARMVGVLDALGLTELVTSIPGVSAIGAAAILAETGDPDRYDCPRTWVKHAGLAPRDIHTRLGPFGLCGDRVESGSCRHSAAAAVNAIGAAC